MRPLRADDDPADRPADEPAREHRAERADEPPEHARFAAYTLQLETSPRKRPWSAVSSPTRTGRWPSPP